MSTVSSSRHDAAGSQTREDSSSYEVSQNLSQSSSSSSQRSSQDTQLQCSESMISSTPSDESQQSQETVQSLYKKASPQLENKSLEVTEINGKKNGSHQIDSRLTIPVDKELTPSSTGRRSKSPRQRVGTPSAENGEQANTGSMQPHTLAAHTNLSRLAEIATSQPTAAPKSQTPDVHQPPGVLPGQHISQVHSQLLAAQARYLTPGQNISLPVGLLQQNHFPIYSGYQHVPAGSVFQQVPGQMAAMPLPQGQYPPPFMKGSIIQLASGDLKRVEDLMTEDFVQSTKLCPDLKLETSTVVLVNENAEGGIAMVTFSVDSTKQQVTLNCPCEHPFFVYGQGWSSHKPEQSQTRYNLQCHRLKVGDVCIFLSPASAALLSGAVTVISQGGPVTAGVPSGSPNSEMPVTVSSGATGATPSVTTKSDAAGQLRPESVSSAAEAQPAIQAVEVLRPHQTQASSPQGPHAHTSLNSPGIPIPGNIPTQIPHYQALPASYLGGAVHPQSLVHGAILPQSGVGNGLLMTAFGIVPGRGVIPLAQQGTIYGNQAVVESLPKQATNGSHIVVPQQDGKQIVNSEDGQSEPKRLKVDGEGK